MFEILDIFLQRKTFEDERANFLTQQIFQMTPFQGTKTQSKTTGNYTIKDRVKSKYQCHLAKSIGRMYLGFSKGGITH